MVASRDYEELFELLNSGKVKYLVVGAHALAFHGKPRFTGDLDIFISTDPRNADRLLRVVKKFGFTGFDLTVDDFRAADNVVQLGYPPWRIDLLTGLSGIGFNKAWNSRVRGRYGKAAVRYISKSDLIINKKSAGRLRDKADLKALDALSSKPPHRKKK